jgi:tetratricopeptide (TPR) repeat protein
VTEQNWSEYTASGVDFFKQSDYREALEQFEKSLPVARDAGEKIQSLHNLSLAAFNLSLLKEGQAWIDEGLTLAETSPDLALLKACLLNTQGRYFGELEKYNESEAALKEAIAIARPLNLLYALEMSSNLALLRQGVHEWKGRDQEAVEDFAGIADLDQKQEIVLDLLGGFRIPSPSFDIDGAPNPEVFQARLMLMRVSNKSNPERRAVAEKVIELQNETLAVTPNLMAHVYSNLSEFAIENADYLTAAAMSNKSLETINQSHLRSHAISSVYLNKATTPILISGDVGRAGQLLKDAEALTRAKCGEKSAAFLRSKDFRIMLASFVGGIKPSTMEQISNLEDSVRFYAERYPAGHSAILHMRLLIIRKYLEENKFDEAEKVLDLVRSSTKDNFRPLVSAHHVMMCEAMVRFKQGRKIDGQALLSLLEEYALGPDIQEDKDRIEWLQNAAEQYSENGLFVEAERLARLTLEKAANLKPAQEEVVTKVKKQLGIILNKIGKTAEGSRLLAEPAKANTKVEPEILELQGALQEAMQLHAQGEQGRAAMMAVQLINNARPYLPKTEQIVVMASAILMEQAKLRQDGPEIVRITSMLSDMPQTIGIRAIMPLHYKEAALAFAAKRDLKAGPLFEEAIKLAEENSLFTGTLDDCLHSYQLFCTAEKKPEKAEQILERLIELREKHDGPRSIKYASAISDKAINLSEHDAEAADKLSRKALTIFAENPDADPLQYYLALATGIAIATRLDQVEYRDQLSAIMKTLKEKLDKALEAAKQASPGAAPQV